jgi:hypothetical protein
VLRFGAIFPAVVILMLASAPYERAQALTPQQQFALDIYKKLVETGDTSRAADAMAARLVTADFDSSDVQVFKPAPRNAAVPRRPRSGW